jgi:hypothetical protein
VTPPRYEALRDKIAHAVLGHYPERRTPDGPISGCSRKDLRLGESYAFHLADLVIDALGH